jgi:hypothetical protein
VGPLLKPAFAKNGAYIYKEKDIVHEIYFLTKGKAGFVIPECDDLIYIFINIGDHFGISDLVPKRASNILQN